MAIYEMGPGAAATEYFVINWMLRKVGWRPAPLAPNDRDAAGHGGGVLTSGGSLANLTALIAARSACRPGGWAAGSPPDLAVMAPANNHYSIGRAVGILGIGTDNIYPLDVDTRGAIRPDRLQCSLERIRQDGRRAMALIANACSTAVGIYDPLRPIGEFCRSHDIWLHVDGAHGATALLSGRYRQRLDGIELADSVIWDAHKMMRTPAVCAAVLTRDHRSIDAAFSQEASYLFHDKEQPGFDFLHRTVECTKHGMGLKFFMVLAGLGERGMAEHVERQYALAEQAYEFIAEQDDFECAVKPEANILCFRTRGSDELHLELRKRVLADGRFYLTTTMFNDRRYLRVVFMNPGTALSHFSALIDQIRGLLPACDRAN